MMKNLVLSGLGVFILSSCLNTPDHRRTFDPREVLRGTDTAKQNLQSEEDREKWLGKGHCEKYYINSKDCQAYWRQKFEENPLPAARKQAAPAARTQADNSRGRTAEPSPSAFSQACGEKTLSECLNQ